MKSVVCCLYLFIGFSGLKVLNDAMTEEIRVGFKSFPFTDYGCSSVMVSPMRMIMGQIQKEET